MKLNKTLLNKITKQASYIYINDQTTTYINDYFIITLANDRIKQLDPYYTNPNSKTYNHKANYTTNKYVSDIPDETENYKVTLPINLKKIIPFASTETTRPAICCINFTDQEITATDSYKLITTPNHTGDQTKIVGLYNAKALEITSQLFDPTQTWTYYQTNDRERRTNKRLTTTDSYMTQQGLIVETIEILNQLDHYPETRNLLEPLETQTQTQTTIKLPKANNPYGNNKDLIVVFSENSTTIKAPKIEEPIIELEPQLKTQQLIGFNLSYLETILKTLGETIKHTPIEEPRKPVMFISHDTKCLLAPLTIN